MWNLKYGSAEYRKSSVRACDHSNETGYSLMPKQYEVADGVLKISLQKYSAVIFDV